VLVPTMFLAAGLSVPVDIMVKSIFSFRAHLFVQFCSFVLLPILGYSYVTSLRYLLDNYVFGKDKETGKSLSPLTREFALGMIFLSCIPTTIGLATAVARALNADASLTIVNSIIGNIFGVWACPTAFMLLSGYETHIDAASVVQKLSLTVVLPLIIGLILRAKILPSNVALKISPYMSPLQSVCILTFLSTAISQNAHSLRTTLKFEDVPLLLVSILGMYTLFFYSALIVSRLIPPFSPAERVACLLSGTQKTAAMGVSIISLLFENDPILPIVTMPLLMYHPSQVALSTAFAINAMKKGWAKKAFPFIQKF
jgi:solute carrier family 10 (sodium/bile acid cotransporter), member 7